MKSNSQEVIFIGFPSLTHNYGGLSADNIASSRNRGAQSSPLAAALQVLALMQELLDLGQVVGVLPPQLRPHLPMLAAHGFSLENAPLALLEKAASSSAMWVANAATIAPSVDSADGLLHITTANLHSNEHRRIEAAATHEALTKIFEAVPQATIHTPLEARLGFRDEGAANHMRLALSHDAAGLHIFVYGGRQNLAASQQLAAQHQLPEDRVLFLEQSAEAIAAGVFHNDVIAVSHLNLLLVHEKAYAGGRADIAKIAAAYSAVNNGATLQTIVISEEDLRLEEAVNSYFFNSQIVSKKGGELAVIAPQEIEILYGGKAAKLMRKYFSDVQSLDLRQSMQNGGGPACLRLRLPMTDAQIAALRENSDALVDAQKIAKLETIARKYYPESLRAEDLRNPQLRELCAAVLVEF